LGAERLAATYAGGGNSNTKTIGQGPQPWSMRRGIEKSGDTDSGDKLGLFLINWHITISGQNAVAVSVRSTAFCPEIVICQFIKNNPNLSPESVSPDFKVRLENLL
jgi:hypothetical protein